MGRMMAGLANKGRIYLRLLILMPLLFNGCAAVVAVSAIPGVLVDHTVGFFSAHEASLPVGMQQALASVQQGLSSMSLQADVLEPVEEGYAVEFGNGKLDGNIRLKRQTESLTTLTASAYRGMTHEVSVEQAIVKAIHQASERT
ncbi:MAG: hypothetical protein R8K53_08995, partial [Mariprofundaceae bacterium]